MTAKKGHINEGYSEEEIGFIRYLLFIYMNSYLIKYKVGKKYLISTTQKIKFIDILKFYNIPIYGEGIKKNFNFIEYDYFF